MAIGNVGGVGRLGLPHKTGVGWWRSAAHLLDGVAPGFFLDVVGQRYAVGGGSLPISGLLTISNAAPGTYIDATGVLRQAAANTPRIDWTNGVPELLLEGALTNKVTCAKHNPTATTNLAKSGDAAATLSVVDDTAALVAAGLSSICTSGTVYKFDNSAGTSTAFLAIAGTTGNTAAHSVATYARGTGTYGIRINGQGQALASASSFYSLVKREGMIPGDATKQWTMDLAAGSVVWFVLPQMVEASVIGSVIPGTTTAAVTRTTDLCTLTAAAAAVLQGAGAAVAWRGGAVVIPSTSQPLLGTESSGFRALYMNAAGSGLPFADNNIGFTLGTTEHSASYIRACWGFGASGQRGTSWGEAAKSDSRTFTQSLSSVSLPSRTGCIAGQILRVRQLVGWSLPDRPSAAGVQAQARAA